MGAIGQSSGTAGIRNGRNAAAIHYDRSSSKLDPPPRKGGGNQRDFSRLDLLGFSLRAYRYKTHATSQWCGKGST